MTAPPTPARLARELRSLAKLLDQHGDRAVELAPLLAARGFPSATMGAPGGHGSAELTSVEAAADAPAPWRDVDDRLARWLRLAWGVTTTGQDLVTKITAHAAPDGEHEGRATSTPGAGHCLACDRWVTGGAADRLRAGFCNACRNSYQRWRRNNAHGDRAQFIRWRRGGEA